MSPLAAPDFEVEQALATRAERAGEWLHEHDYRGWDPYDGLESPVARLPLLRSNTQLRFAFQQIVKRTPFNLRPALRIAPGRNPVTLALAAQGNAYLACSDAPRAAEHAQRAHQLCAAVAALRSPGWSGNCWGYDFHWQARRVTIPAFYPTIVATGIVTNALFEVDRLLDSRECRELVIGTLPFLTEDLNRTHDPDGAFCWSYSPRDRQVVLNATMKGGRLCAQVSLLTGEPGPMHLAESTVAFVSRRQRADGSWPYAEGDERSWSDNFHTGYVLDAMRRCQSAGVRAASAEVLGRGLAFYVDNFFADDWAPLYYPHKPRPIDATACAQSILTLSAFAEMERATRVAEWTVKHMTNPDGSFAYRLNRWRLDRTPFPRWSVAWMFCALSRLIRRP